MRDYFEEMNIDYNELKRYEDIETYYDEIQDYTKLIKELQCDRVEALKQIVNKNKEIERLNNNIDKAIEYMKEVLECNYHGGNVTFDDLVHNTEHILRGSDK